LLLGCHRFFGYHLRRLVRRQGQEAATCCGTNERNESMKTDTGLNCLAFALALSAAGCGGLSGTTDEPSTLVTLQGEIDNSMRIPVDSSSFRLAVVWTSVPLQPDGSSSVLRTAEDIAVTPSFPAAFQLALKQTPPPEVFISSPDGAYKVAGGSLVAYEDSNHNGKLDILDAHSTATIDRVLAVMENPMIFYIEGDVAAFRLRDDEGKPPSAGFQFFNYDEGAHPCAQPPTIVDGPSSCPTVLFQPITTPLTLSLSLDPALYTAICSYTKDTDPTSSKEETHVDGSLSDFGGHLPDKTDPHLVCRPDLSAFLYETETTSSGTTPCTPKTVHTHALYLYDPSFADQWPCPLP
jgi:hypothetical protein